MAEEKVQVIDKDQEKQQKLMEEDAKRFLKVSDEIIALLEKGEFTIIEWSRVYNTVNGKINKKIDNAHIKTLMQLK